MFTSLTVTREEERKGRLLFPKTDWTLVRSELRSALPRLVHIKDKLALDRYAERFIQAVQRVVKEKTPRAKPSPYAKRWWSDRLTALRQSLSSLRNHCTSLQRQGQDTSKVAERLAAARTLYLQEIKAQKRKHWREFPDDQANVWKANSFTRMESSTGRIPTLVKENRVAATEEEKANLLLDTFFPKQPEPERSETYREQQEQLRVPPIEKPEVEQAILLAHPDKGAGVDEMSARVWSETWQETGDHITNLYEASLRLGHLPAAWKTAKIIPLRKPGRDYTMPKAYRPISLLATISKGLDTVVARRVSYLAEEYQLLPHNHFGARRKRSCEQALNVLVEKIYEAWRGQRVLSLVTFDVQGAYNGVSREVLLRRLRERLLPEDIVQWVDSFCSDRKGCVVVNGHCSPLQDIIHPGIPQGSPLSPILYILYNAGLVEESINKEQGALGFVDDYTAWVTGASVSVNTEALQQSVIPKVEKWACESGVTFEAEKTKCCTGGEKTRCISCGPVRHEGKRAW